MFGLGMNGLEKAITDIVQDARRRFNPCTYVEIGVASGGTLCQIAKLISEPPSGWRAVGVERENGYSFQRDQVDQNCTGQHFQVSWIKPEGWNPINPPWNRVSVCLCDARDFFEGIWKEHIHIALIDACHCKDCATKDFLGVEKYLQNGGLVMFHDFDPNMRDFQQVGHGPVDVVGACEDLGLLNGSRQGWDKPMIFSADKHAGGSHMMAIRKL